MALPELMMSVAVGSLILTVIAIVSMTSARSFVTMGNYVNMDDSSRTALDEMSRAIRQAGNLTAFDSSHMTFSLLGSTNSSLGYKWDASSGQLTEWNSANATTNLLLSGCDQLTFALYDSSFAATTNILLSKGIRVSWKCSRTILGNKTTTEDMQQGLIIMRNKPI